MARRQRREPSSLVDFSEQRKCHASTVQVRTARSGCDGESAAVPTPTEQSLGAGSDPRCRPGKSVPQTLRRLRDQCDLVLWAWFTVPSISRIHSWRGEEFDAEFLEIDVQGGSEGGDSGEVAAHGSGDTERSVDHWSVADVGVWCGGELGVRSSKSAWSSGSGTPPTDSPVRGRADWVRVRPQLSMRGRSGPKDQAEHIDGRFDGVEIGELAEELLGAVIRSDEVAVSVYDDTR